MLEVVRPSYSAYTWSLACPLPPDVLLDMRNLGSLYGWRTPFPLSRAPVSATATNKRTPSIFAPKEKLRSLSVSLLLITPKLSLDSHRI